MFQQGNKRHMANAKVKDTKRKPEDCKTPAVKQAQYCRGKLGHKPFVKTPYFDLSDPNFHVTDTKYNSLHDPHLRKFFNQRRRKELVSHGLITKDNKVLCSLVEFKQHQRYKEKAIQNWEKNFLQEQKLKMKRFMKQIMARKMTEGALKTLSEEMKVLLMDKARISFRKVCRNVFPAAEAEWARTYKLQLEKMEKEVMRELRLEHSFKMDKKQEKKANLMEASVNLDNLEVSSSVSPSPSSERDETPVMDMMDQATSSKTSSSRSGEPVVSGVGEKSVVSDVDRAAGHSVQVLAQILEESSEGEAKDLEDLEDLYLDLDLKDLENLDLNLKDLDLEDLDLEDWGLEDLKDLDVEDLQDVNLEDLEDLDLEDRGLEDLDVEDLEDVDLDLDPDMEDQDLEDVDLEDLKDLDPDLDLDIEDLDMDLKSLPEKPKEDQKEVEGPKLKKKKKNRLRAFFQRAWRAIKRTFCSKKVAPIG